MEKINFVNNVTKCNADTFNTMQNNIETAINSIDINVDDTVSISSTNAIENQAITNYVNTEIQGVQDYADEKCSYSTTEKRIGTWINNKPIYRTVLTGTLVDGDLNIGLSSLNIAILTNSYGRCGTTGNYRPLNFYLSGYYISTRYSGGTMYIASSSAYAGEPFELVVEYTKSTD